MRQTAQTILRLFRPLSYLRVKQKAKWIYDFGLPILLSGLSTVAYYNIPLRPPLFGATGIVTMISEILKFLSPFFIAALAAIATFDGPTITTPMKGVIPTLMVKMKGVYLEQPLSRRQFLCLVFGYLSLQSLFLYFLGYVSWICAINITSHLAAQTHDFLKLGFVFVYLAFFYNVVTTTMLGLFYLAYRLHWDE